MLNTIIIMGRLTRDPEIRYTSNNTPVVDITIAVSRSYIKDGERKTDFIKVVCWRKLAEFVNKYFVKSQLICVRGSLHMREWTDKDGNSRLDAEIEADDVFFTGDNRNMTRQSHEENPDLPVKIDVAVDFEHIETDNEEHPF